MIMPALQGVFKLCFYNSSVILQICWVLRRFLQLAKMPNFDNIMQSSWIIFCSRMFMRFFEFSLNFVLSKFLL